MLSNYVYYNEIQFLCFLLILLYLPSSSIIVTALLEIPTVTFLGREFGLMVRMNVSSLSSKVSFSIETLNEALVLIAENVTMYGPEV